MRLIEAIREGRRKEKGDRRMENGIVCGDIGLVPCQGENTRF